MAKVVLPRARCGDSAHNRGIAGEEGQRNAGSGEVEKRE
jgi:hypothetical protein